MTRSLAEMKLLPTKPLVKADDTLGTGMDAVLLIAVFLGLGFGLDRWLGTTPWFTVGFVLFAAVGWFLRMRYTYETHMLAHESARDAAMATRLTSSPAADTDRDPNS